MVRLSQSVWYGVRPDLTGLQLAFLLSLGGTALATAALPTRNVGRTMVLSAPFRNSLWGWAGIW